MVLHSFTIHSFTWEIFTGHLLSTRHPAASRTCPEGSCPEGAQSLSGFVLEEAPRTDSLSVRRCQKQIHSTRRDSGKDFQTSDQAIYIQKKKKHCAHNSLFPHLIPPVEHSLKIKQKESNISAFKSWTKARTLGFCCRITKTLSVNL